MRLKYSLRLWRKFRRLPPRRQLLLVEAALWLLLGRVAILFVPFPRIARYLGKLRQPDPATSGSQLGEAIAREVAWAVDRSARIFPFRMVCFPRGLAAWQMLYRRGVPAQLHFGASRRGGDKTFQPHAWLDACGVEVTGYPEAHQCAEIGYFAR